MTEQVGRARGDAQEGVIATAFARALGREPSDTERVHLYRLAQSMGFHEDDAIWTMLFAFRHFLTLYEEQPAKIEAAGRAILSQVQQAAAEAAKAAVAAERDRAKDLLVEEVAKASAAVADVRATAASRRAWWLASSGLCLFGGFSMLCGWQLGRGRLPFWMSDSASTADSVTKVIGAILGAPAGWVALVLLLPILVPIVVSGWTDWMNPSAGSRARRRGMTRCGVAVLALCTCIWMLGKFAGGWL